MQQLSSQIPAPDDVGLDAFDDFFNIPASLESEEIIEEIIIDASPELSQEADQSRESLVSSERISGLEQQLKDASKQLQAACLQIGYLKGQLAERDEQLRLLPDYRAQAARAIVSEVEGRKMQEHIVALETELSAIHSGFWWRLRSAAQLIFSRNK